MQSETEENQSQQINGEIYELNDEELKIFDKLERIGEVDGYLRISIFVESNIKDDAEIKELEAFVYVKPKEKAGEIKLQYLTSYTAEHAILYKRPTYGLDITQRFFEQSIYNYLSVFDRFDKFF